MCKICNGTGWEVHWSEGYDKAKRCKCRALSALSAQSHDAVENVIKILNAVNLGNFNTNSILKKIKQFD